MLTHRFEATRAETSNWRFLGGFTCWIHLIVDHMLFHGPSDILNPFASEAVYTRNFFSDRMSDSV